MLFLEIVSGVAQNPDPKRRALGAIKAHPTTEEVKRKIMAERPSFQKAEKNTSSTQKGGRADHGDYSDSKYEDYLLIATKRKLVREAASVLETSLPEIRGTLAHPEAETNRSTIETEGRATFSSKTASETEIRPSNYDTATEYTIAQL